MNVLVLAGGKLEAKGLFDRREEVIDEGETETDVELGWGFRLVERGGGEDGLLFIVALIGGED